MHVWWIINKTAEGAVVEWIMWCPLGAKEPPSSGLVVTNAQLELNFYHIKHSEHSPSYNWLLGIKCHICWSKCQNLFPNLPFLCIYSALWYQTCPSVSLRKCRDCCVCQLLCFTASRQLKWDWQNGKSPLFVKGGQHTRTLYLSKIYTLFTSNLLINSVWLHLPFKDVRGKEDISVYQTNKQKKEAGRHHLLEGQRMWKDFFW